MRKRLAVLLVAGVVAGCKGDVGPMGPPGPPGPPGPAGPGNTMSRTGQLNTNGGAVWVLPSEAGSVSDPPALSCYLSDSANGPYLLVSTDTFSGISCGLVQSGSQLSAVLSAGRAFAGWYYRFVIVYD